MESIFKRIGLDFLWIFIYLLSTIIAGLLFCRPITEGYICMFGVGVVSLFASLFAFSVFLILRLVFKNVKTLVLSLSLILFISFELVCWIPSKEPSLFGVFASSAAPYEYSKLAVSMSSLAGVFIMYGICLFINPKQSKQ